MKREELRAMGLTEEQVNAIMKQNGQDIEAAKKEAAEEKERADGLQTKLDTLTGDLEAARKESGNFKDLKARLDAADAKVKAYQQTDAILSGLAAYKPKDPKMMLKLIDRDKIVFAEDGSIVSGLKEQMDPMKEASAFLFADAPDSSGGTPPAGGGGNAFDMNAFLRGNAG